MPNVKSSRRNAHTVHHYSIRRVQTNSYTQTNTHTHTLSHSLFLSFSLSLSNTNATTTQQSASRPTLRKSCCLETPKLLLQNNCQLNKNTFVKDNNNKVTICEDISLNIRVNQDPKWIKKPSLNICYVAYFAVKMFAPTKFSCVATRVFSVHLLHAVAFSK